jgi:hypothetical protein
LIENTGRSLREKLADPLIVTFIMAVVIFITPAIMTYNEFYQIFTAIIWVVRFEQGEPLRAYLALEQVFAYGFIFKYLFLVMIYRYYRNETTFLRAFRVGAFSEIYLYISSNLGSILIAIFQVPGFHPNLLADIPLPISLLLFLVMVKLIPRLKPEQEKPIETWLEQAEQ